MGDSCQPERLPYSRNLRRSCRHVGVCPLRCYTPRIFDGRIWHADQDNLRPLKTLLDSGILWRHSYSAERQRGKPLVSPAVVVVEICQISLSQVRFMLKTDNKRWLMHESMIVNEHEHICFLLFISGFEDAMIIISCRVGVVDVVAVLEDSASVGNHPRNMHSEGPLQVYTHIKVNND